MSVCGIMSSSSQIFDPDLTIAGEKIPFIRSNPVNFLGGTIKIPSNQKLSKSHIQQKLLDLLSRVDNTPVTRKQKIHPYKLGICAFAWSNHSDLPLLWLEKTLGPLITKYLKHWSGLAKSANTSRLFLPQSNGGLKLSSFSSLYKKMQVGKAALLLTSRDAGVQQATKLLLQKEKQADRKKFKLLNFTQKTFTTIPEASRGRL